MANKRVSELTQITTGELNAADLFLLSDVSALESKKLTLGDLNTYILTGGNLTGSLFGTSSWAENAVTASIANTVTSASYAVTASFSLNGGTGGSSVSASWASQSLSSSYAQTASFVSVANAATASFATASKFADSASFLIYTGGNNGTVTNAINAVSATTSTSSSFASSAYTSSYALSSSIAASSLTSISASNAVTASYALFAMTASVGILTTVQASASWASQSLSASFADTATDALTAITASYVLPNLALQQEGIFLAITQSNYRSQLDKVSIVPFFSGPATTSVEAVGTMVAPYTSSIALDESVTLYALGRETGILYTIDSTPIYVNIQGQYSSISASVQASVHGQLTGSVTGSTQGSVAGSVNGSTQGVITGSVTGSTQGVITGSVNGSTQGEITGSVTGSTQGSISGTVSSTITGEASGSISGSLVGQFTGSISGSDAVGDITGSISASYDAILTASISGGTLTGDYAGSLTSSVSASYSGSLVGTMTGNYTGSLTSSVSASYSGSLVGTMAGNYTGSLTSSISASFNGIITGSVSGSVSTFLSGAMKIPFSLMGQLYLPTGSYMFFISASTSKVFIEPTRISRFSVASNIGQFSVESGEVIQLTTTNTSDLITFSSSMNGGPFIDTAANIVASGSSDVTVMDVSAVGDIRYVWTCTGLRELRSLSNINLTDVQGMPASIVTMSLQSGNLSVLYDLSATSCSILNVMDNSLSALPALPSTMSYIDCSLNPILSLPDVPYGVTSFFASSTGISSPPDNISNTVQSMSFDGNVSLNLWLTTLPTSLSSFDVSSCPLLTALPTIPANVRYLNINADSFTDVAQDNICSNLVSNGLLSGSLNLLGNDPVLPITVTRITTLQSRAWTVTY